MTKRKGTRKPTGGAVGNHSSARKRAMIRPALDAIALKSLSIALERREQQLKIEREAFEEERRVMKAALDKQQGDLDEQNRLSREKNAAAEKPRKPAEIARMESAVDTVDKLAPRKGELLTSAESRVILMIYFTLVGDGISPNQAAIKVSLFGSFKDGLS